MTYNSVRGGNRHKDGIQFIKVNEAQYLPVYCDMTTSEDGFTLPVTRPTTTGLELRSRAGNLAVFESNKYMKIIYSKCVRAYL